MRFGLAPAPHAPPVSGVPLVMRRVLYALAPAAAVYVGFFGWGLVINFAIAAVAALLIWGSSSWPEIRPFDANTF
jgi:Na+-translocating ferredoxin:NAD+ oxidoreductase RnfD subunit